MKRVLLLLNWMCVLSVLASAQTVDFAPVGATWVYTQRGFFPPPFSETPHVVEVESKEMYQGQLCSKLVGLNEGTVSDPLYVYTSNDSVFFYSDFSEQFELLYDFGAEPGESWIVNGLGTLNDCDSLTVVVDSLSVREVSGVELDVIHVSYPDEPAFYEWWDEIIIGIGNTMYLTPNFGFFEYPPMGIRCYTAGDTSLQFVTYPCDTTFIISSTADVEEAPTVHLSPNPFSTELQVELELQARSAILELYDLTGILRKRAKLLPGITSVAVADLAAGVYLWQVRTEDGRIWSGQGVKY
jgi:hypothetical protein